MSPFYRHLQGIPGFGVASSVDKVGVAGVGVVAAAFAAHGVAEMIRHRSRPEPEETDLILRGRDACDAWVFTQRICGVCVSTQSWAARIRICKASW